MNIDIYSISAIISFNLILLKYIMVMKNVPSPVTLDLIEVSALKMVAETATTETRKNKLLNLIDLMCEDVANLVSGYTLKNHAKVCMHDIDFLNNGLEAQKVEIRVKRNWSDDDFEADDFCLARVTG